MIPALASQPWAVMGALLCAFAVSIVLVLTKHQHGHLTLDNASGIQSFHVEPTPRIGGLGIYFGVLIAWGLVANQGARQILGVVLLAGIPAFGFGLLEDVTRRVGVLPRLFATMAGGLAASLLTGVALNRLDVTGLDWLLTATPIAVCFTAFAVGGIANAFNIIDGFHGLASGASIIALAALATIGGRVGDMQIALACILVAAAVAGFWLVNFPWGKLFMGDGGAYFVGFAIAWLAVLLAMRNPGVSPWAAMLVCVYPVIEVAYSVIRRYADRRSPGHPDTAHLHSLVKFKVIRKVFSKAPKDLQNAAVSPVIWVFSAMPAFIAVAIFDQTVWLAAACAVFVLLYHVTYRSLAQTGFPRFRGSQSDSEVPSVREAAQVEAR